MAKIELKNNRIIPSDLRRVVDTNFTEFGNTAEETPTRLTVDQFFEAYEELFYLIPQRGENSHEYMIQRSSEYANFEAQSQELSSLMGEIADLQQENARMQEEIVNLEISGSNA